MANDDLIEAMHFDFGPLKTPLHDGTDPYVFTYTFRDAEPDTLPTSRGYDGWTPFTVAEKATVREALGEIEGFANVVFREDPGARDPVIDFGKVDLGTNGQGGPLAGYRGDDLASYDAFAVFNSELDLSARPDVVRHEIGHALGLKHPFEGAAELPGRYQNNGYTVMSYTSDPAGEGDGETYEILDVLALQHLWGANPSAEPSSARVELAAIADGELAVVSKDDDVDAISAGDTSERVHIDLRPGTFSSIGGDDVAAIALDASVDTAVGGRGRDRLDGANADETLIGRDGADTIVARGGDDELRGGFGSDVLFGGRGEDTIFGGGGGDRIDAGLGFDKVFGGGGGDVIAGGSGRDWLSGGRGRDEIYGNRGNDTLIGGGGGDDLRGGQGGDRLLGDRHDDVLDGGDGNDALWGGTGADVLRGAKGFDRLYGQIGDDVLFGGAGGDVLAGGPGDDVVFGGAGADEFHFANGDGSDVIRDFGRGDNSVLIAGLGSRREILDATDEVDGDVIIELGGQTLTLMNTSIASFEDGLIVG